jgi:hypothetical protein
VAILGRDRRSHLMLDSHGQSIDTREKVVNVLPHTLAKDILGGMVTNVNSIREGP